MLTFNHQYHLHDASDTAAYPHFVHADEARALSRFEELLWVQHPVNGIWWPWLTRNVGDFVDRVENYPALLNSTEHHGALDMGLLVNHATLEERTRHFENWIIPQAQRDLREQGWARLNRLTFPTYWMTADYYARNTALGPDDQVPGRMNEHNPPLFCAVHRQFTRILQRIVPEAIKPSYCYFGRYPEGSELKRHTDRPQCRWNVSILLHKSHPGSWPLYIQGTNGRETAVDAAVGEPVIYRGTDTPHWRQPLAEGHATAIFFHYVQQEFAGDLR